MSREINDVSKPLTIPAPPPPPAPKAKESKTAAKASEKAYEKAKETDEEAKRQELYKQCVLYHNSKSLGKFIPSHLKCPDSSWPYERLLAHKKAIWGFIHTATKEIMVYQGLQTFVGFGEIALVEFAHMEHLRNISGFILQDPEFFQPELEEVAIELPDDYIPSPTMRLAMKVMHLSTLFLKHQPHPATANQIQQEK